MWGLKSHTKIVEIDLPQVSIIHNGFDGTSYFIGFDNGDVKEYDNAKLEDLEEDLPNIGSTVTGIVSSPDYVAYCSDKGKVIQAEDFY